MQSCCIGVLIRQSGSPIWLKSGEAIHPNGVHPFVISVHSSSKSAQKNLTRLQLCRQTRPSLKWKNKMEPTDEKRQVLDRYCPLTKHGFPDLVPDRSSCTPVRIAQWCLLRGKINRSNVRPLLRKVRRHRINSALIFVDLFSIICANQVKSYGEHCNGSLKTVAGVSNSHCKTISSYQWILLRREDNENEESRVILALSMKTTSNVQQILRFGENEFTFNT